MKKGNVILLDPDPVSTAALRRLLQGLGYAVRHYETAAGFRRGQLPLPPHCLVTELSLPDASGWEVFDEFNRSGPGLPTIFLTARGDIRSAVRAMRGGAVDFLTKPFDLPELAQALERGFEQSDGQRSMDSDAARWSRLAATLTRREREVVHMVLSGMLNKEVAERLQLALITVKVHRGRAMKKLGARNAAELARIAHATGLAKDIAS
jgi:FixJ family two-component response regulator